jgi:hypothetical protein
VIIGDFDRDFFDDIMVYNPSSGSLNVYSNPRWFNNTPGQPANPYYNLAFIHMPGFKLGNLAGNLVNKRLYVGEFGQDNLRTDLIMYDPATRQISRFDAVQYPEGSSVTVTFWWAFTTYSGFVTADEDVVTANISGDTTDDIVLHSRTTGKYRFFKGDYLNGGLAPSRNASSGQLDATPGGKTFFGKFAFWRGEPGYGRRTDAGLMPSFI